MRILLINKFREHRGGAERSLLDQERWLTRAGHDVAIFSQKDDGSPADDARHWSIPRVELGRAVSVANLLRHGRLFWSPDVAHGLIRLVGELKPDVALLHNVYHQLGPAVVMTLHALRVPMLMLVHDHKPACPAYTMHRDRRCSDCKGQRFYHAALNSCGGSRLRGAVLAAESYWQWNALDTYRKLRGLVVPSRYMQNALSEMRVPLETFLLRNAVAASDEAPLAWEKRRVVGFAGRLSPEKGISTLLEVAARLPTTQFKIAGTGPLSAELKASSRRLPNVHWLGQLSGSALRSEMRHWRMALVPSLVSENCPYAVLDAMAQHVPVIGANVGGIPELLSGRGIEFQAGSATALASAMQRYYDDYATLGGLTTNARRFIEQECEPTGYVHELERLFSLARA